MGKYVGFVPANIIPHIHAHYISIGCIVFEIFSNDLFMLIENNIGSILKGKMLKVVK